MPFELWLAWFAACWAISLSPGAGVVATLSTAVRGGFTPAFQLILGLQLGAFLHVLIGAAGLGALLAASELAFTILKWLGAAYLAWLAIKQWKAPPLQISDTTLAEEAPKESAWQRVLRGFLVNASNPKAVLFVLAVFPQFLNTRTALLPQYGLLAITMSLVDLAVMSLYALLAARILRLLHSSRQQQLMNRGFAALFLGAAAFMVSLGRMAH